MPLPRKAADARCSPEPGRRNPARGGRTVKIVLPDGRVQGGINKKFIPPGETPRHASDSDKAERAQFGEHPLGHGNAAAERQQSDEGVDTEIRKNFSKKVLTVLKMVV